MTVEMLIEFLQTLPKDAKVVKHSNDKNCVYREVDFQFVQTFDRNGKIEKTLKIL